MNLQDLKEQLISICKELKKELSWFKRRSLNKQYNKIMDFIKLNYKGGIY